MFQFVLSLHLPVIFVCGYVECTRIESVYNRIFAHVIRARNANTSVSAHLSITSKTGKE
jgi:hypothetical protein